MIRDSRDEYLLKLPVNPNVAMKVTLDVVGRKCKDADVRVLAKINNMINSYKKNVGSS